MRKVLVVDNDRDMCNVISDVLREEGYGVQVVHDGKAALAKIAKHSRCDAMVLDYRLSGMSGLTILDKVRNEKPPVPTIMISAFGDHSTKTRAKELGAADFLDKPFNIKKLVRKIKSVLDGKPRKGFTAVPRQKAESKVRKEV